MKYVHTNLIARDWRKLAEFYCEIFNCKPVPPERDLKGEWLDNATGVRDAHIRGVHLRLPGYGEDGPTLEIFQYGNVKPWAEKMPNTVCFGHIAFEVDDVRETLDKILSQGGGAVGELTEVKIEGAGTIRFVYARDPEGNIIEVQEKHR